jgi:hypothetical protein
MRPNERGKLDRMRLAPRAREELVAFFGDEIAATGLPLEKVRFFAGPFTFVFLKLLRVNGLTLGRRIFVLADTDRHGRRFISASLAVHELCHVFQYERNGGVRFLTTYLRGYWKCLRKQKKWDATARLIAYMAIPEEIEAQCAENRFIPWRAARRAARAGGESVSRTPIELEPSGSVRIRLLP